jgi:hypothetical protein
MFLSVPLIADWQAIARTPDHHVIENFQCANRKRCQFDYAPGQHVLKNVHNPTQLGVKMKGPYTIECVHINSNLNILLREGITKRINIHRLLPYCYHSTYPCEDTFLEWILFEVFTFTPDLFSPPHI